MPVIPFEFEEDRNFFSDLLYEGEDLEKYSKLLDFRDPDEKRKEFNKQRNILFDQLLHSQGRHYLIGYEGLCDLSSGVVVDHLIPLSSNKLNKEIRRLKSAAGKKVKTQSFGSNNPDNLIIACCNCNNYKKHKFLNKALLRVILESKYFRR